jgi:phosphoribosylformylglycinamidine synthase
MLYKARVEVSLKPGHSDPEGETTARSLRELMYQVKTVGVSKMYSIVLEAASKKEAEARVDEMCRKLLANPTKDNYILKVEEAE